MNTKDIKRAHCKTPTDAAEHDWRKEPWVMDGAQSDLDAHQAFAIAIAMNAFGDNPQDEEDEKVFMLMRPDLTEAVAKSDKCKDVVRFRVAQAIAQCLKTTREMWVERYGSHLAKGQSTNPTRCFGAN